MVSGAEGLQTDVRQLQLLFPQFVLQLEYDFRLGLGALAQPVIWDYKQGGKEGCGGGGSPAQLQFAKSVQTQIYERERERESWKENWSQERKPLRQVQREGWRRPGPFETATIPRLNLTLNFPKVVNSCVMMVGW